MSAGCTSSAGDHQPARRFLRGWVCLVLAAIATLAALLALAAPALAEDTSPPQVTAFSITPSSLDTSSARQSVTVTATLTDNLSGIGPSPWVVLHAPGVHGVMAQYLGFALTRVSGDALDGVYSGTEFLPRYSQAGVWTAELRADDLVGNEGVYDAAAIDAACGAGSAELTDTATAGDTTPPQVTAFSITPSQVDTGSAGQNVTATMTLHDDMSGVDSAIVWLSSPSPCQQAVPFNLTKASGDDLDCVWSGTATLPVGSKPGIWTAALTLQDDVHNSAYLTTSDLDAKFGAGAAKVTDTAAWGDTTPPRVTALSVSPTEIDTESADQQVSVSATIADDQSGVASASLQFTPLIGGLSQDLSLQRVSGDATSGVYTGTLDMPQGSVQGMWGYYLAMTDKIGNSVTLGTAGLSALFPGADDLMIANTALADQITIGREWVIDSGKVAVDFPAGTVITQTGRRPLCHLPHGGSTVCRRQQHPDDRPRRHAPRHPRTRHTRSRSVVRPPSVDRHVGGCGLQRLPPEHPVAARRRPRLGERDELHGQERLHHLHREPRDPVCRQPHQGKHPQAGDHEALLGVWPAWCDRHHHWQVVRG